MYNVLCMYMHNYKHTLNIYSQAAQPFLQALFIFSCPLSEDMNLFLSRPEDVKWAI